MNNIQVQSTGIKCDNPNCDYKDESVKFEDFEEWLNKPCPECGWNLLTNEDFENIKDLFTIINHVNSLEISESDKNDEMVTMQISTHKKLSIESIEKYSQ